jgi:hypothetical protein
VTKSQKTDTISLFLLAKWLSKTRKTKSWWQLTVAVFEPRGVDIFVSDGLELFKLQ